MNSNRTIVDLQKVAYVNFYWCTAGQSIRRFTKPKSPTVNGQQIGDEAYCPAVLEKETGKEIYPRETQIARAARRKLIDVWQPLCILQLCNSHSLQYTGAKALSLWKAWCERQFGKHKRNK